MTDVKTHGMLFKPEMIEAIVAGRKTQTRRVMTGRSTYVDGESNNALFEQLDMTNPKVYVDPGPSPAGNEGPYLHVPIRKDFAMVFEGEYDYTWHRVYPRIWPEELIYIREACYIEFEHEDNLDWEEPKYGVVHFKDHTALTKLIETGETVERDVWVEQDPSAVDWKPPRWRSPIHMPKWAVRHWLKVTNVRLERIQEINGYDAQDEGIIANCDADCCDGVTVAAFRKLWNSINTKRGFAWEANPWVIAITFERGAKP